MDIPSLDSRWAKHPSTLLSLADAVLDGKPLVNGPRHMAHVVEVIEKTWIAAESRQTVDLTTTFPMVSWKDLPIDTSTAKLVKVLRLLEVGHHLFGKQLHRAHDSGVFH